MKYGALNPVFSMKERMKYETEKPVFSMKERLKKEFRLKCSRNMIEIDVRLCVI